MAACEHLVQFYETQDELLNAAVPYLAAGLDAHESVLVIATEPHRLAFEHELAAMESGFEEAVAAGTYISIDASGILDQLCDATGGGIDPKVFDATIGTLVQRLLASGRSLRAYGEVVALMWERGDATAAIALDELWSRLQEHDRFTLFCGYPGLTPTQPAALRQVCRSHSCLLPTIAEDTTAPIPAPLSAEFTPSVEAPGHVRALLRSTLRELQFDEDLIERGTLTASELAANAVLHAHTPFRLLVQPGDDSVWIAVEDGEPLKGRFDVFGRSPHGLGLIAGLARRWGVIARESGKVVWAEIPQ